MSRRRSGDDPTRRGADRCDPSRLVRGDDCLGERVRARVLPQRLEAVDELRDLVGLCGAQGPLDARLEPAAAEVRAADEPVAHLRSFSGGEEVGLGVEAGAVGDEQAHLQAGKGRLVDEQAAQGDRFGDVEVVAGEQAEPPAGAGQQRDERLVDDPQPRCHDEADRQADLVHVRVGERVGEGGTQRPAGSVVQRALGGSEVVAAPRDDVAHPATRVAHVAVVARDHVEVQVIDGLPGRGSGVETDVVAVGSGHPLVELVLDLSDQVHERGALGVRRGPPVRDDSTRHGQRVPGGDGETVVEREGEIVLGDPLGVWDGQERGVHELSLPAGEVGSSCV